MSRRIDHDFNDKWHWFGSYRDFKLVNLTSNQMDIGGIFPGRHARHPGCHGPPAAAALGLDHWPDHIDHSDHHQYVRIQLPPHLLAVVRRQRPAAASRVGRRGGTRRRERGRADSLQREFAEHPAAVLGRSG